MTHKVLAGAAAIGAATAAAALLIGSTTAGADEPAGSSAYGIAASGLLPVPPTPHAEWDGGEPVREQVIGLSESNRNTGFVVSARVLTADASEGAAESSVADVVVADVLRAKLVRTYCEDGEGGLRIVEGSILGTELPDTSVPSEEIDASPLLSVTLNEQERGDDGALTVRGIVLRILPGAGGDLDRSLTADEQAGLPALGDLLGTELPPTLTSPRAVADELGGIGRPGGAGGALQTVIIGSSTCGGEADKDDEDHDAPEEIEKLPEAPAPEIVEADLPVTG